MGTGALEELRRSRDKVSGGRVVSISGHTYNQSQERPRGIHRGPLRLAPPGHGRGHLPETGERMKGEGQMKALVAHDRMAYSTHMQNVQGVAQ
ncbi:hypothetical protein NDU88_004976 [Pleurodeles waltl]|uniref:Uncharacterized protein n=1 Tax=Pleurodeles waltl TaxID=8319 RepID=A0AAV7NP73_PLEWA|nr:hypothetical protein NDU88_004976 [Pleurodeles waltl]